MKNPPTLTPAITATPNAPRSTMRFEELFCLGGKLLDEVIWEPGEVGTEDLLVVEAVDPFPVANEFPQEVQNAAPEF